MSTDTFRYTIIKNPGGWWHIYRENSSWVACRMTLFFAKRLAKRDAKKRRSYVSPYEPVRVFYDV